MLYSFLCATLWALTGIFIKLIDGLTINSIIFFRFFIAMILGLFFCRSFLFFREKFIFSISSLMTIYYVSAAYAFYFAPVSVAALIIALSPLFTLIIRMFLKDSFHRNEVFGFIIAFIGLAFYFIGGGSLTGYSINALLIGGGLAFLAAFVRAAYSYNIWIKSKKEEINLYQINVKTFFIGTILFLPITLFEHKANSFSSGSMFYVLGLGILATFIPNMLNNLASGKINPTVNNVIGMSTPITASIMAWVFLGEKQSVYSVLCMLIVVLGIFMSMTKLNKT